MNWSAGLTGFLDFLPVSLAIAAAAWLVMRITPRMNAATRHAVWWLVLAAVILLPIGFTLHDAAAASHNQAVQIFAASAVPGAPSDAVDRPAPAPTSRSMQFSSAPSHESRAALAIRPGKWAPFLLAIWASVFAVQLLRLAWSYLRLRAMKQRAHAATPELQQSLQQWVSAWRIRRNVRLLVSSEAATPLAAGFFHPAVVLPSRLLNAFSQTELDHVLMHELAHLARRDDWANLICRIAYAALWFHPAAVIALRRIDLEREMACDEWVVSATGAARPYAASLARLFEFCFARRREALASGMAGHGSHLGERIEVLVRRKDTRSRGVSVLLVAAGAFALIVVVSFAAHTPRWVVLAHDEFTVPIPPAAPAPPEVEDAAIPPETPAPAREAASPASPAVPAPAAVPAPPAPPAAPPSSATADPHSFLGALVAAGYGDLSVDEIIQLRNGGVSGDYILATSKSGWGKLKPADIINLHNSGVSAEFLRSIIEANIPGINVQGVIDLNSSGVGAAYIASLQSAAMIEFSKADIINLHNSGVKTSLIAALRDSGFTHLDVREIIDASNSGLRPDDLREARKFGSSLTLKQVIKLKQAGVI